MNLIIKRDSGWADRIRAYEVILDGAKVAEIRDNQEIALDVKPGDHELAMRISWAGSNVLKFTATDKDIKVSCKSNLRGFNLFLSFIYALESLTTKDNWIRLEIEE